MCDGVILGSVALHYRQRSQKSELILFVSHLVHAPNVAKPLQQDL